MAKSPDEVITDRDGGALSDGPSDYEGVCFRDCDFSDADLRPKRFVDCVFERCNLSGADWRGASLNQVAFRVCKMLGADLTGLRTAFLAVSFDDCKLDYANFGALPLGRTRFSRCSLVDASFIGTDLSDAVFVDCDVTSASFRNTSLMRADLRGADGLVLDPEANRIHKAKLSAHGLAGLLTKYQLDID